MINYPYMRLLRIYFLSKTKQKLDIKAETDLFFKAGIFDIDPYQEINNGRYHILADIGRFNHGFRTGFFAKAIKHKLSFTVAGSTAKYRHRIQYGKRFKMTTKIIFTDEKWAYYLTNFFTDKKLCVSIMARTGTIKNGKLINTKESSKLFDLEVPNYELSDWILSWIKSDEKYPGF